MAAERCRLRSPSVRLCSSKPSTTTEPAVRSSSPAKQCSRVVLPEPLGPVIATNSPRWIARSMSWSTTMLREPFRNVLPRPVASMITGVPASISGAGLAHGPVEKRWFDSVGNEGWRPDPPVISIVASIGVTGDGDRSGVDSAGASVRSHESTDASSAASGAIAASVGASPETAPSAS